MCVHAKVKTRNQKTSNGKKKDVKSSWKRHKVDKHDRHDKHRNKDASKQAIRQTSKIASK